MAEDESSEGASGPDAWLQALVEGTLDLVFLCEWPELTIVRANPAAASRFELRLPTDNRTAVSPPPAGAGASELAQSTPLTATLTGGTHRDAPPAAGSSPAPGASDALAHVTDPATTDGAARPGRKRRRGSRGGRGRTRTRRRWTLPELVPIDLSVADPGAGGATLYELIDKGAAVQAPAMGLNQRRETVLMTVSLVPLDNEDGRPRHVSVIAHDVEADSVASGTIAELRELAYTDRLTRLGNRVAFNNELAAHRSVRDGDSAVLFCDLDGFKPVNDRYGHEMGDQILTAIGEAFDRLEVAVYRWGGDEFAAVTTPDRVERLADEIVGAVRAVGRRRRLDLGASIGIVFDDDPDLDDETLVDRADAAMYRAKTVRDGQPQIWDPSLGEISAAELAEPDQGAIGLVGTGLAWGLADADAEVASLVQRWQLAKQLREFVADANAAGTPAGTDWLERAARLAGDLDPLDPGGRTHGHASP